MWFRISSAPAYRWPDRWMSAWSAPWRWLLAIAFHVSWLSGRASASLFSRGRQAMWTGKNACPTGKRKYLPHQILVIRTDGIGDAVLFEPALASLKERFADHELVLWASASVCELMGEHPAIACCAVIPRGAKAGNLKYFSSLWWRVTMGWRLGHSRFDVAIYAVESPEPLGNWVLRSVRASEKWYAFGDLENQFAWQRQRTADHATKLLEPLGRGHELLRNAHLASQWGGKASLTPRLHDRSRLAHRQAVLWRSLARSTGASGLVGIMAGSATAVNAYPPDAWVRVVKLLWQRERAFCIFFGGPDDKARVARITGQLREVLWAQLPIRTDLRTAAALLPDLDGFISMDTGLAHVAVAQGVPTVVLCNGGHPGRFFPWPGRTSSIVLNHPMPCEGCLCRCVLNEPECVTKIAPEQVLEAYARLIRGPCGTAVFGCVLPKAEVLGNDFDRWSNTADGGCATRQLP